MHSMLCSPHIEHWLRYDDDDETMQVSRPFNCVAARGFVQYAAFTYYRALIETEIKGGKLEKSCMLLSVLCAL